MYSEACIFLPLPLSFLLSLSLSFFFLSLSLFLSVVLSLLPPNTQLRFLGTQISVVVWHGCCAPRSTRSESVRVSPHTYTHTLTHTRLLFDGCGSSFAVSYDGPETYLLRKSLWARCENMYWIMCVCVCVCVCVVFLLHGQISRHQWYLAFVQFYHSDVSSRHVDCW